VGKKKRLNIEETQREEEEYSSAFSLGSRVRGQKMVKSNKDRNYQGRTRKGGSQREGERRCGPWRRHIPQKCGKNRDRRTVVHSTRKKGKTALKKKGNTRFPPRAVLLLAA